MNNRIALNTPTEKEWIAAAIEMIKLAKVAFKLQNNEIEYAGTLAPVEMYLMSLIFSPFSDLR